MANGLLERKKRLAAQAPQPRSAPARPVVATGRLEQYQAAVAAALSAMAPMPTLDERQAYKRKVLPEILPFVDDYVTQGERYPNSVAVQAMIWLFDIGDIERALNLALYLIDQGLHRMPTRFDRDLQTFVSDEVSGWSANELKENRPAAPYLGQCIEAMEKNRWELHPLVSSKLYVQAAKHAERLQEYAEAVEWCLKAERVNSEKAGVKTLKDRCLKAAKLQEEAARKIDGSEQSSQE